MKFKVVFIRVPSVANILHYLLPISLEAVRGGHDGQDGVVELITVVLTQTARLHEAFHILDQATIAVDGKIALVQEFHELLGEKYGVANADIALANVAGQVAGQFIDG